MFGRPTPPDRRPPGASTFEDDIHLRMCARNGQEGLLLPSGRLALFLALVHWCRPGGRVLMAPVNDDVILFVVLAAGLRPVFAPVDPRRGSMLPDAVPEETWRTLGGVITTNLYGVPDPAPELRERCLRGGIPLIEDAAHALQSTVGGRPVGCHGDAAAFSLSKHAGARSGGYLAVRDTAHLPALRRAAETLLLPPRAHRQALLAALPVARDLVVRARLVRQAWQAKISLGLDPRGSAYRMPPRPDELRAALAAISAAHACAHAAVGPGNAAAQGGAGRGGAELRAAVAREALAAMDPWTRVDLADYRMRHGTLVRRGLSRRLAGAEAARSRRLDGVRRLLDHPAVAPGLRDHPPQPLFRVPLLVRDRDRLVSGLLKAGIATGYLYDPPLDDYAGPEFVDPSPAPEAARWFARHVLPVDPLEAARALAVLDRLGAQPAAPPTDAAPPIGAGQPTGAVPPTGTPVDTAVGTPDTARPRPAAAVPAPVAPHPEPTVRTEPTVASGG
ncbi:DegT/DnrJ/EryC1/StrS family aminotransferase [Allostreptomyces psammosilenae]|uniref:DegT/DnrJ/EryC1/StrS aminotransferase family protein n=1 Tax=Allostreptomyces psammosilenae TaxID=1892865 RepID=A0A853A0L8_9ACTN|nr:DegT/DnrJ/EryC1/StrS family aminotransferase [Allostreptomyces psammosilenae]NYI08116.1 hypothetical protein [Allostreptomyces psammosilenae]